MMRFLETSADSTRARFPRETLTNRENPRF
jgi:hypothetical protein